MTTGDLLWAAGVDAWLLLDALRTLCCRKWYVRAHMARSVKMFGKHPDDYVNAMRSWHVWVVLDPLFWIIHFSWWMGWWGTGQ